MRVAIDMQGALTLGSRTRGIGRFSKSLVSAMVESRGAVDLRLVLNDVHDAEGYLLNDRTISTLPGAAISRYRVPPSDGFASSNTSPSRRIADAIVRRHVATLAPDVMLITSCFEMQPADFSPVALQTYPTKINAAILYDLIPLFYKDEYLKAVDVKECYLEMTKVLQSSDLLLAISESSKRDAVSALGIPAEKIAVISAAADRRFRPIAVSAADRGRLTKKLGITRPFVLYIAGADARKNLRGTIAAFAALPAGVRQSYQLLLITNMGEDGRAEHLRLASKLGIEKDGLVISNYVADDELVDLLNIAQALLFPSFYEGFGLPLLEAMQCGLPVLASRTSSLPEIVDRDDILFDPSDTKSMAAVLQRVLTDEALRADLTAWGPRRASLFSWERSAKLAIEAMQHSLERTNGAGYHRLPWELLDLDGARHEFVQILRTAPDSHAKIGAFVDCLLDSVPNPRDHEIRRLLIDVTHTRKCDDWTGIQRVVRRLTTALYESDMTESGPVPVAVRMDDACLWTVPDFLEKTMARKVEAQPHQIEIRKGDDLLMLDSNWIDYPNLGPFFEQVQANGGRVITTIYDLLPELHPEFFTEGMPLAHSRWLHAAIAWSDALLCISRAVADQVVAYINEHRLPHRPLLKVGWFHLGSDIRYPREGSTPRREVVDALSKNRPMFLSVGTLEPRKGQDIALSAFEQLWDRSVDTTLCFIGARGWKCESTEARIRSHPEHGKRLFWFDTAGDADLIYAYEKARAVLCMSYAEGFGLPIVEAARLNRPVICSDIPVFREVGGEGSIYFEPGNPVSLAGKVLSWLDGSMRGDPFTVARNTWGDAAWRVRQLTRDGDWEYILRA